jgi:D-xylose transport system permease protein
VGGDFVALFVCAAIGACTARSSRLGVPSFVVTLAGLLGWQGVMLLMLGKAARCPSTTAL